MKIIGRSIGYGALIIAAATFIRAVFFAPESDYLATLIPASFTESSSTVATTIAHLTGKTVTPKPKIVIPDHPAHLEIPSINLKADVQEVGKNDKGAMASPTNFKDVGWYKPGVVPGEIGSAVMDGHVDNALALPGVFKHLSSLRIGDDVYVVRNDGKKLHFKVTDIRLYPEDAVPVDQIFDSSDDAAHLNLITCAGEWKAEARTYNDRLVVYTTLAD